MNLMKQKAVRVGFVHFAGFQHYQGQQIPTQDRRSADVHTVSSCSPKIPAQDLGRFLGPDVYWELPLCALGAMQKTVKWKEERELESDLWHASTSRCVGTRASPYRDTAQAGALPICLRMASQPTWERQQRSERVFVSCVCPEVTNPASLFHQTP